MTSSDDTTNRTSVQIEIAWPFDTYQNAPMVNQFSFTVDDNQGYIAFGNVPPLPGPTPLMPPKQLPIPVLGAFTFRPSFLVSLRNALNEFAKNAPELFGEQGDSEPGA